MDIRNFHQSPEEIIKTASPEQRLMWNRIFLLCGDRAAISQLVYIGPIAGSEFATFTARKLYFAYEIKTTYNNAPTANPQYVIFYSEMNAAFYYHMNNSVYWDATAAAPRYLYLSQSENNMYFGRMVGTNVLNMKFVGFRIIY